MTARKADVQFSGGGGGETPIDLAHLHRQTLGDRQVEEDVLALFADHAPAYLERLRQAGDGRAWREAAHTIKGAARGIGAADVAREAERVEAMPFAQRGADRRQAVTTLEREIKRASRFIRDRLAGS